MKSTLEVPLDRKVVEADLDSAETIRLSARLEPFDSYWQAPEDVEAGYKSFSQYYKHNFLPHLPANKEAPILVVSCGPGYLVEMLNQQGYRQVLGIDSDGDKIAHAKKRNLNCIVARAFSFLHRNNTRFQAIICEQELNHLTIDEMILFLRLCRRNLDEDGVLVVYGLNGANPIVGAENLAHNIDHFSTFTEYSLTQVLTLAGFDRIKLFPLKLYVFWKNPLNYVGLLATGFLSLCFRVCFALYGKKVKILTKKIAAVCRKGSEV
ncbi:MAG TPA: class I SAM-dependent methyltransferase [Acidobacteriota bacterium]|nr:class I SAM-dependent methyltransferase [Acidobacteriota bacterium]